MKKRLISMVLIFTMILLIITGCSTKVRKDMKNDKVAPVVGNLKFDHSMEIKYAKNFSVDYYEGGYGLISISNNTRILVVPENKKVPEGLDEKITVIQQPISNVYMLATSSLVFFDDLDSIDVIRLSGTKVEGWFVDAAVREMKAGNILFSGKYSNPDYELIKRENCKLSIQSNMITHAPEVKEKLEELGLTVLIDLSSYESNPLGRTEWIKAYSVLLDKEKQAEKIFNEQAKVIDELKDVKNTGKTVAFFYVNAADSVIVRNSNDYVPKMIEMAGGNYIFKNMGDPNKATSTTKIGMEEFYATAKNADYIMYNSSITGEIKTLQELLEKSELFSTFKAVKDGNVWCTGQNFYQSPNEFGSILKEINTIITTEDKELTKLPHFNKLK